jgi:hypothetical protein
VVFLFYFFYLFIFFVVADYGMPWDKPQQYHRSHSVGRRMPAATMLRPETAQVRII